MYGSVRKTEKDQSLSRKYSLEDEIISLILSLFVSLFKLKKSGKARSVSCAG